MKRLLAIGIGFGLAISSLHADTTTLRSGDQIDIRLGGVPADDVQQVSGQYQIDGTGNVNMPNIGKVKAAGLTQSELQSAIENAYKTQQIYTNPTITVNVSSQARFVNVAGEVKNPRRVEFTPDLTVLASIAAAGGFTEYADQTKVRLIRGDQVIMLNVKEMRRDAAKNIGMQPGDSIEVQQSFW